MAPFKSKSQLRKFASMVKKGEMSQKTFSEWLNATPSVQKLPEKAVPKKSKVGKVKILK